MISAQREGSLSEATSPETDQSDPFYAHCKLHVDKLVAKLVNLFYCIIHIDKLDVCL